MNDKGWRELLQEVPRGPTSFLERLHGKQVPSRTRRDGVTEWQGGYRAAPTILHSTLASVVIHCFSQTPSSLKHCSLLLIFNSATKVFWFSHHLPFPFPLDLRELPSALSFKGGVSLLHKNLSPSRLLWTMSFEFFKAPNLLTSISKLLVTGLSILQGTSFSEMLGPPESSLS